MTSNDDTTEVLHLPEPARTLFRTTRPALDEHVSPFTPDGQGYKLGGGTVLAARWTHRSSDDIDLVYHPDTDISHFPTLLDRALRDLGGKPVHWGELSRIEFGNNHVDLMRRDPIPAIGHRKAIVDNARVTVLTSVQILNGKLRNRALDPPIRDIYDIAVCGIEDPESLEIAINGLYEARVDSMIMGWKMNRETHAAKPAQQIRNVPRRLDPIKHQPAEYAIRSAERALYDRVLIACDRGVIHVHTSCPEATRTRTIRTASELQDNLETTGINSFLRVNGKNAIAIRKRANIAIRQQETGTLLDVTPRRPPTRQEELEPISRRPAIGEQPPNPQQPAPRGRNGAPNNEPQHQRTIRTW